MLYYSQYSVKIRTREFCARFNLLRFHGKMGEFAKVIAYRKVYLCISKSEALCKYVMYHFRKIMPKFAQCRLRVLVKWHMRE